MMRSIRSCDLFCAVVDNYGDIGIASRLARQLCDEHGLQVRLWVDNLHAFNSLHARISVDLEKQEWLGIEVRHWTASFPSVSPNDLVIEAFACELPEIFVQAMARREPKPVWLNLEYLSAESWVEECHGLPSPHPRLPLAKYFYFPGYTQTTGGLLRERGLTERIRDFRKSVPEVSEFWSSLGLSHPAEDDIRMSLFAYENPAIPSLFDGLVRHDAPVMCLLPSGKALGHALEYMGAKQGNPGDVFTKGNLTLRILPFLQQEQYDKLLWACDINVVRGEDSFVRAQFAGKPVLWQAYVQEGDTHEKKVRAWLEKYLDGLPAELVTGVERLFMAWNRGESLPAGWLEDLLDCESHAGAWADHLGRLPSLSEELVKFARNKL